MKLLAFETATEACSVALYVDGEIIERHEVAPRRHAELALPWAEALLAQAGLKRSQLDAIALSRGPGAFTGVRLAVAIAQGIALALDLPAVAVSTLEVMAMQGHGSRVLAAIDARMGEVYAGAFERRDGRLQAVSAEVVCAPDAFVAPDALGGWSGVGTGFAAAAESLRHRLGTQLAGVDASVLPRAADLARLAVAAHARGEAVSADRIEPAYLRNDVALTLDQQQARRAPA